MRAIGVDTHKATLACCLVDELGSPLDERSFANDPAGHRALLSWSAGAGPDIRIGLEGSASFGGPAARLLVEAGRDVREVPPQLSHRERLRTRRAGKTDAGDALAIARVTAREPDLPPVRTLDGTRAIQLLVEAREDLVAEATRVRNRLHADLLSLSPGYGGSLANLVTSRNRVAAGRLLRGLTGVQAELARDRLARLNRLVADALRLEHRLARLVEGHPLRSLTGAGVLATAKVIGEAGDVHRFRSADAFAMLAGVAPIPASSGQTQRVRLNRGGNRQLNRALYVIALVQAWHHPPAKAFVERKRLEGKTWREALRCLKRHLARIVFRLLVQGATRAEVAS
jgi:transposase